MRAVYAARIAPDDPLSALEIGERPEPERPAEDWVTVDVRASSLNHHDLWSLQGVGLSAEQVPMILGCDAAGVDPDGDEVVVHSVIDRSVASSPPWSMLSEYFPGTFAERIAVPSANLVPKPPALSFAQAACLPTAWLTAYRMLTTKGRLPEGGSVLVQGAGGGVATAAVILGVALGARVYATSRDAAKRERIAALGATALDTGARLPERVDVVVETVGAATFEHSMKCAKRGGRIVVSGATSGHLPEVNLRRVFALELEILGSSMGTRDELAALVELCAVRGVRPVVDSEYAFGSDDGVREAFGRLAAGDVFGKIVIDHTR
jgi:NADPH:quinone reductase-like Zn-dependent oxidoreductase